MTELDLARSPSSAANAAEVDRVPESLWADVWHQFRRHSGALTGISVPTAIVLIVLAGPHIWTANQQFLDISRANKGMSLLHPRGTENLGRDTLA